MPRRLKNREIVSIVTLTPLSPSRAPISLKVISGRSSISCSSKASCASSFERRGAPIGFASSRPVARYCCTHFTAELGLTSNSAAAARRESPRSTHRTTRSRRSREQGLGISSSIINKMWRTESHQSQNMGIPCPPGRFNLSLNRSRAVAINAEPLSHVRIQALGRRSPLTVMPVPNCVYSQRAWQGARPSLRRSIDL